MSLAAQNLPGLYWHDRWPPQHVPACSDAARQHSWKVSFIFFVSLNFLCILRFLEIILRVFLCSLVCLCRQLRRHLSLSMISKLLDGSCTYRPTEKEFQVMFQCNLYRVIFICSSGIGQQNVFLMDCHSYFPCIDGVGHLWFSSFFPLFSSLNWGLIFPVCNLPLLSVPCSTPPARLETIKKRTWPP